MILAAFPAAGLAQRTDTPRLSIEDAVTRMLRSSDKARAAWQLVEGAEQRAPMARARARAVRQPVVAAPDAGTPA